MDLKGNEKFWVLLTFLFLFLLQNIELKVEAESLKKELEEKQELLDQAL